MQRDILRQALALLETSKAPRTTVKAPFTWNEEETIWRPRYGRVGPDNRERLLKLGDERRLRQAKAKQATAGRAS
jgi:hypothetical protein